MFEQRVWVSSMTQYNGPYMQSICIYDVIIQCTWQCLDHGTLLPRRNDVRVTSLSFRDYENSICCRIVHVSISGSMPPPLGRDGERVVLRIASLQDGIVPRVSTLEPTVSSCDVARILNCSGSIALSLRCPLSTIVAVLSRDNNVVGVLHNYHLIHPSRRNTRTTQRRFNRCITYTCLLQIFFEFHSGQEPNTRNPACHRRPFIQQKRGRVAQVRIFCFAIERKNQQDKSKTPR